MRVTTFKDQIVLWNFDVFLIIVLLDFLKEATHLGNIFKSVKYAAITNQKELRECTYTICSYGYTL